MHVNSVAGRKGSLHILTYIHSLFSFPISGRWVFLDVGKPIYLLGPGGPNTFLYATAKKYLSGIEV